MTWLVAPLWRRRVHRAIRDRPLDQGGETQMARRGFWGSSHPMGDTSAIPQWRRDRSSVRSAGHGAPAGQLIVILSMSGARAWELSNLIKTWPAEKLIMVAAVFGVDQPPLPGRVMVFVEPPATVICKARGVSEV